MSLSWWADSPFLFFFPATPPHRQTRPPSATPSTSKGKEKPEATWLKILAQRRLAKVPCVRCLELGKKALRRDGEKRRVPSLLRFMRQKWENGLSMRGSLAAECGICSVSLRKKLTHITDHDLIIPWLYMMDGDTEKRTSYEIEKSVDKRIRTINRGFSIKRHISQESQRFHRQPTNTILLSATSVLVKSTQMSREG